MRSWDGIPGILANLPFFGASFAKLINTIVLRQKRLFAWPNIWAKKEIVPELIGQLNPQEIANLTNNYLERPEQLQAMRNHLTICRGQSGAANKIALVIKQQLVNNGLKNL